MDHDLKFEIEQLKQQMADLREFVHNIVPKQEAIQVKSTQDSIDGGSIVYSGRYQSGENGFQWEPQERKADQLIQMSSDKMAKVLAALGHKQRLDILKTLLNGPLSGAELVEQLQMGTTGQLYHHLKSLIGANLVLQEKGGKYSIPNERILPFLLLLTGVSELIDTSDFIRMMEVKNHMTDYLGVQEGGRYDAHLLLWAVVENSLLEHSAGHCSEVHVYLHNDGSATVADNGRGIPTKLLPQTNKPMVQSVLTDIDRLKDYADFKAPGASQGISIAVVNALSDKLTVETRREGKIYRQDYKKGIPQTELMVIGATNETGTSITFIPDYELFTDGFTNIQIEQRLEEIKSIYPSLSIQLHR